MTMTKDVAIRTARSLVTTPSRRVVLGDAGVWLGVSTLAAVVLWLSVNPLAGPTNDTDAAASVLYFQRLVSGARLEAFWPTTSKPLLTIAYGVLWQLTHDWRALTVVTLLVGAMAVGFAAVLARRLAGVAAAAFIVTALLSWPDFRIEVGHANSFIDALALWLIVGLSLTADRPRPRVAAIALLGAGLVRPESFWLVAAVATGVIALTVARRLGRDADPWRYVRLLLGGLAMPILCLHDWLLTGQPLYWLQVAPSYTILRYPTLRPVDIATFAGDLGSTYRACLPLGVLVVAGLIGLVIARRWAVAAGLAFMMAGVVATLAILGLRGVYIDTRYYEELNAPLLFAGALGLGAVAGWAARRSRLGRRNWALGLSAVLGLGSALIVSWPQTPSTIAFAGLDAWREANSGLSSIIGALPAQLASTDGSTTRIANVGYPVADARTCLVYVPRPLVPRIAVESGARITALGDSYLAFRDGTYSLLHAGQWVLHMAAVDGAAGRYAPFEAAVPTAVRSQAGQRFLVDPAVAQADRGIWLDRIEAVPGS